MSIDTQKDPKEKLSQEQQNNENLKAYSSLPKSPDTYRNLQIKKTIPLAFLQKKLYFCRKHKI